MQKGSHEFLSQQFSTVCDQEMVRSVLDVFNSRVSRSVSRVIQKVEILRHDAQSVNSEFNSGLSDKKMKKKAFQCSSNRLPFLRKGQMQTCCRKVTTFIRVLLL
jgi:hypothetical protein